MIRFTGYNFFDIAEELEYDIHDGDKSLWDELTEFDSDICNGYMSMYDIKYLSEELDNAIIRDFFKLVYEKYSLDYMHLHFEW